MGWRREADEGYRLREAHKHRKDVYRQAAEAAAAEEELKRKTEQRLRAHEEVLRKRRAVIDGTDAAATAYTPAPVRVKSNAATPSRRTFKATTGIGAAASASVKAAHDRDGLPPGQAYKAGGETMPPSFAYSARGKAAIAELIALPYRNAATASKLVDALSDDDWLVREAAISELAQYDKATMLRHAVRMEALLEDPDWLVRQKAATAVGWLLAALDSTELYQHAKSVVARLTHRNWEVRHAAVMALSKLTPPQLAKYADVLLLRAGDEHEHEWVKKAAAEALKRLTDEVLENAVHGLEHKVQEPKSPKVAVDGGAWSYRRGDRAPAEQPAGVQQMAAEPESTESANGSMSASLFGVGTSLVGTRRDTRTPNRAPPW